MDVILGEIHYFLCSMIRLDLTDTKQILGEINPFYFFPFSTMSDGDDMRLPAQRVRRQT